MLGSTVGKRKKAVIMWCSSPLLAKCILQKETCGT